MPFVRPTLTGLRELALQDVYAALGVKGLLRFAVLRVLAWVQAGMAHMHYGYLDWVARQAVPFTATAEYLEAWAALVGVLRKPAVEASGSVTVTGAPGTAVPVGTVLRRAGDASGYVTRFDAILPVGGVLDVAVVAQAAGAFGNTPAGAAVAFAAVLPGVTGVSLLVPLRGGADEEADEPFRGRMLLRYAAPPQGGAAGDYVEWALGVPGVTRAWVNPLGAGAGTVVVYTMWDDVNAGRAGVPQGQDGGSGAETRISPATLDKLAVADVIYPLRPVTALVYSVAPTLLPVAFVIHPRGPVPLATQLAVLDAIDGVFLASASPLGQELQTSGFEVAIAAVPGMPDFTMTGPGAAIVAPLGSLPVRGTLAYV